MIYTASQPLIDVLFKNGFNETTEKKYPEHYERLKNADNNTNGIKRAFGTGTKGHIVFDYINIIAIYRGSELFTSKSRLTEDEVKSIIAFFKLPSAIKQQIKTTTKPITDLHFEYHNYMDKPFLNNSIISKSIIKAYEEVII